MSGEEERVTYEPAVVTQIPVDHIERNPHNPRVLFDPEPMKVLFESIRKVGVLVPITVYPKIETATNPRQDQFVLLDGERRWRCVRELGQVSIPAIIVEKPTDIRNILTMFHIHNLRLDWQLMPTALKLEVLMERMNERNERKLAQLTKLSVSQIRRCKILLSYQRRFQNMMLAPPTVRLKPDFFIELQRIRGPALQKRFPPWVKRGDMKCINIMLQKYKNEKIEAVTDFRILAEIYRGSVRIRKIELFYRELDKFLADENRRIEDIDVPGATFERESKEVLRSVRRVLTQIRRLPPEAISADRRIIRVLKSLSKVIQEKLEKALVEELPYVRP